MLEGFQPGSGRSSYFLRHVAGGVDVLLPQLLVAQFGLVQGAAQVENFAFELEVI